MNIPKETENKIMELQMLEQSMHNFAHQKQKFQIGLSEVENALGELGKSKEQYSYKVIGDIMIKTKKEDLEKDLNDRKNILELRLKNIEKQEDKIKEKAEDLQREVMKIIQNERKPT